jgi:hypothetical protein
MPADNRIAEAKNVARDGMAFLLVGIEEFVGGTAVRDQGQFPGQVMGVHDSGVHALATCWRVNVHGVPSQQDPPSPVRRRSPELTAKTDQPAGVGDNHPPRRALVDQVLDLLKGRRLAGAIADIGQHDPPPVVTHWQAIKRQAVSAEKHMYLILPAGSFQGDVSEQPVLWIWLALKREPEFMTYAAVRAVATHQIVGYRFGLPTREVPKSCVNGASVLSDVHQFHTVFDGPTQLAYAGAQQHFGLVLRKHRYEPVWGAVPGEVKDGEVPLSGVDVKATHSVAALDEGAR